MIAETTPPETASIIVLKSASNDLPPNVVSIVDSRVIIDTNADVKLIALADDIIGLLYFRYLMTFFIANANAINVNNAIAIVVIS